MSEYNNPRPLPTASASDPCTIVDNAISFDKVLNGNSTVTTYKGKQILSLSQAIDKFGFGVAPFTFTNGGTLEGKNLLVSNDPVDGFLYKYIGSHDFSTPLTVTAGTNPTVGSDWQPFTATDHNSLSNRNAAGAHDASAVTTDGGGSVQDFIDDSIKLFDNSISLSSSSGLQIDEIIYLKGYEYSGDGAGHFRKISTTNDGTGIAVGANFANIVTDAGYIDTSWLGTNVTISQIKTLLDYSAKFKPKKIYTLNQAWSLWAARQEFHIAFFGDSTTDGYGTTGHIASAPTPSGVDINESPNAYPQLLEGVIKRAIPSYPAGSRVVYNAGFDSQSMVNGFALEKFDSIFIESGAPFLGTKMIGFAWGVTDVINLDYPITALSAYAKNLEALIVYSLAKGMQPFLASPVPMWITGDNGRNGWQLLSLIDEMNENLAIKYNLEIVSLREGIEVDTNKNGNPLSYFSTDRVHPNNFGHSAIAGGLFKQLCSNVFEKDDIVSCGSPNIMKNSYSISEINKSILPLTYDYGWTAPKQFKFFVFLDEQRNLVADSYCLGNRYVTESAATVTVYNFNKKTSKTGSVFSSTVDFYNQSNTFSKLLSSDEFIDDLEIGLNEIDVNLTVSNLGLFKFAKNNYDSIVELNPSNFSLTSKLTGVETFSAGLAQEIRTDLSCFYLSKGTGNFTIRANAFNILNSAIMFNITKDGNKFNCLKILPSSVEFGIVENGVYLKTGEANAKSGVDITALLSNKNARLDVSISSSVTSTESADSINIKINNVLAYDTIVSTSLQLYNLKQGYGCGLWDLDSNGSLKSLSNIIITSQK